MNNKLAVTEADLQAYVDGRLSSARHAEVEIYLAAHTADAERMAAYRQQNTALRKLFDPVLDEPIPDRLLDAAIPPLTSSARRWSATPTFRIAAAAAWIGLGTLLGWNLRDTPSPYPVNVSDGPNSMATREPFQPASFAKGAALAHATFAPEQRHPVEVAADQEAHLIKWLSNRLGKDVHAPSLAEQGFSLIGGRLLPGDKGPAAQFMYEDPRGVRLTLYIKTEGGGTDTAFRYADENGIGVFYWIDRDFGYALSGNLEKSRLLEVAKVAYRLGGK